MYKLLLLTLIALMGMSIYWYQPDSQINAGTTPPPAYSPKEKTVAKSSEPIKSSSALPEKLKNTSLKGTTIDGIYPTDDEGNLLISKDIKHRFEYFLSTMGEFSLDQVQQMIRDDIELNLQEPARTQALSLFEDYVSYKYALADLEQSLQAPQDYEVNDIERMRYQLQQLRDKRREYLNQATVDAFFGFDEMYDDFMLNRLEIQANPQLTTEEKAEQIQSLEQSLPQEVRDMRDETQKVSKVFKLSESLREQGASEEDIFELNSQEFGQAAAERLRVLDQQRQAFTQKAQSYLAQKQRITQDDNLSSEDKKAQLDLLLEDFDDSERRRLYSLELMENEKEGQ